MSKYNTNLLQLLKLPKYICYFYFLGLKQFVVITKPTPTVVQLMKLKTEELVKIITNISFTQCLVFSNYQTRAESLSNILNQKGWPSTYISAAQTQPQRLEAVNKLKDFKCRIMLSTDLTARGKLEFCLMGTVQSQTKV